VRGRGPPVNGLFCARFPRLRRPIRVEPGGQLSPTDRVFRQVLEPITMMPVEGKGRRFYRATGAAKGPEMLNRLGLAQAVDFGGCGGPIC